MTCLVEHGGGDLDAGRDDAVGKSFTRLLSDDGEVLTWFGRDP